jgi:hypothetical protein
MKRFLAILSLLLLTGCSSLIPKPVEFFQDKVHKMPTQKASEKETQRQAAQRAAEKARQVLDAALIEDASTAVVNPAKEVTQLTDSVSRSLGPPVSPSSLTSEDLSRKLDKAIAKLNQRLDEFKADNDENAGKKIEGSGAFSVPYFFYIAIIGFVVFVIFLVLKTFVHVAAAGNPAVGMGLQAVQLGGRGVAALAKEVIHGGEIFKEKIAAEMPEFREKIEALFSSAHKEAQSPDTQAAVKKLLS